MNKAYNIHEEHEENTWIVTFADLVTLLLVFFILLFSISTIKEEAFENTISSVQSALKGTDIKPYSAPASGSKEEKDITKVETGTVPTDSTDPSVETGEQQQAPTEEIQPIIATPFVIAPAEPQPNREDLLKKQDMARVSQAVNNLVKSTDTEEDAKVSAPKDGKIVINIRGDLFFNPGSAQFKREAMPIMDGIGNILRKNPAFKLAIGGHTDNRAISTNRYPSNWELSAIRATTVLRYFVRGGMPPDKVTATGYGESMPVGSNDTEEQRNENRRIEFVLERKPT